VALNLGNSFVIHQLRVTLRDRMTSAGRMLFYLILLTNGLGGVSMAIKVFVLAVTLASIGFVSIVAARWALVKLQVEFQLPSRATKGIPLKAQVKLTNRTRHQARDLEVSNLDRLNNCSIDYESKSPTQTVAKPTSRWDRIAADSVFVGDLAPGESCSVEWNITLSKRGAYIFTGVRQATSYPWGFWRSWYDCLISQTVLVYPSFTPLEKLDIPVGRRYQPGGIALSSNLGDSTEFVATREFREGDSLRVIHWASWARTGKPVVKEFQEEFFCRIAVVLDTFLQRTGPSRVEEFEQVISLSAAVADQLAREEYVIDLFAAGPELYQLQAGRSLAHLENVLDILACVEPCYDPAFEKVEPVLLDSLESITTTIVILLDWDAARKRLVQAILDRGTGVKVVLIQNQVPAGVSAEIESLVGHFVTLSADDLLRGVREL
jgi:uncharacterized protein (DUF58 family)